MTLRAKIILAIIVGLGVLLVIIIGFWVTGFFKGKLMQQPAPITNTFQNGDQNGIQGTNQINQAPTPSDQGAALPAPPPEALPDTLTTLVLPFVDRFGTYSNQSNYENLEALQPFMTDTLKKWAKAKIGDSKTKSFPKEYYGITTKSLSPHINSLDDKKGAAEIKVTAQRTESVGTQKNSRVYNQDIVVKLVKEDTLWLVDSVEWK